MDNLKEIQEKLSKELNNVSFRESRRRYLGLSLIGHECSRYLWYYFRWAEDEKLQALTKRIFSAGHFYEDIVINVFEQCGHEVINQQKEILLISSHCKGHIDGEVYIPELGELVLLEVKSMKNDKFNSWLRAGMEKHEKQYHVQSSCYAYYRNLNHILYAVINKDNQRLELELTKTDKDCAITYTKRAEDIILRNVPPPRVAANSTYYLCNWCEYKFICWFGEDVFKTCRLCKNSIPAAEGNWGCYQKQTLIDDELMFNKCTKFNILDL